MSLNIVALMGRCTTDPELKTTQNGLSVTSFNIAVDRKYQNTSERQADFIPIVAWRNHAEFITKYFRKGSMIGIEGEIQTRKYQDKNGNNRTAFEVVVSHITFCGSKAESNTSNNANNNFNTQSNADVGVEVDPENDPLQAVQDRLNQFSNSNDEFADLGDAYQDDLPF